MATVLDEAVLDDLARVATAAIGLEIRSEEFRTATHRLAQFAETTGEAGAETLAGHIAAPCFAHVPVMQSMVGVLSRLGAGFAMHGEHDFIFHAPILPGQRLFSLSRLTGLRGTSAGLLLHITSETTTDAGALLCTQVSTCIVVGTAPKAVAGIAPDRPAPAEPVGELVKETHVISPERTLAYAEATRDYSAYCLNADAARAVGLPAPVVHGMFTLSLAARDILARQGGGDPRRLQRLGCRFSQPLFSLAGEKLTVSHRREASGAVGFSATDGSGNPVLTRGYAEVLP